MRLWSAYRDPERGIGRWLAALGGPFYARWCLRRMQGSARQA